MNGSLDRRHLLQLSGLGLLAWFAACRSKQTDLEPGSRSAQLALAWKEAQRRGQPLLVLLAPEELHSRDERGMAWAYCFDAAPPETQAELACCELACATRSEIAGAIPELDPLPPGEPSAFFLDPFDRSARAVVLQHPVLQHGGNLPRHLGLDLEPWKAWLAGLSRELHACFALDRRAAHQRSSLRPADLAQLDAHRGDLARWSDQELDRAPVLALVLVPGEPTAARDAVLGRFAGILKARLDRSAPRGGSWLVRGSCGGWEEAGESRDHIIACGRGARPEPSNRFLSMYTKADRESLSPR